MKNKYDITLRKAIEGLPGYKAKADSWIAIEQYLEFSERVEEVKKELPVYKASSDIWRSIENRIETQPRSISLYHWKVAATIVVLVGAWFFFKAYTKRNLSYSSEIVENWDNDFSVPSDSAVMQVLDFINEQCKSNSYICSEPDFSQKKKKLEEVKVEIAKIDEVIHIYGSSPSLVKTRITLENFKAQLIKDLVNKLTS